MIKEIQIGDLVRLQLIKSPHTLHDASHTVSGYSYAEGLLGIFLGYYHDGLGMKFGTVHWSNGRQTSHNPNVLLSAQ